MGTRRCQHPTDHLRAYPNLNLILGSAYGVGSPTNPSLHCPHRGGRAGPYARVDAGDFAGLQRAIYANPAQRMAGQFAGRGGRVAGLAGALLSPCR